MNTRLANETSPFLRSHAADPVDWYPWCEEAFEKAAHEEKPVFLSIGYSTCHHCHALEREAYADESLARFLNRKFICILVDREERPDIDSVYLRACTLLDTPGGWPMTVFMTAEKKPFFITMYLPRREDGSSGLMSALRAIEMKWRCNRADLLRIAEEVSAALNEPVKLSPIDAPSQKTIEHAYEQLSASFDSEYGGFGDAPKFPSPHDILFLLRYSAYTGDKNARTMAESSLNAMYKGGIYDHFGGGFARYSTDREWLAPHFEKTLYDNALLAYVYTEAWQHGHMERYRNVAESTLDYLMRELLSPAGGYYSGQDADSGGEEGGYYLFTPDEVCAVLGEEAGRHFCECYDITAEGNYRGKSIPNLLINTRWALLPEGYDDYRERLRLYRAEHRELKTDGKILTAWNGLVLMALARAAHAFGDARYLAAAESLAGFMAGALYENGALMSVYYEGTGAKNAAQLDDYVFYALGLVELYAADFDARHILRARELAEHIHAHFADGHGGLLRTSESAETLICPVQEVFDGAMPSGNGGAAMLYDALYRLTGEAELRERRDELLAFTFAYAKGAEAGCAFALCALMSASFPTREILCAAPDENVPELLRAVTARYSPDLTVLLKTPARAAALAEAAPFTATVSHAGDKARFFIRENGSYREAEV